MHNLVGEQIVYLCEKEDNKSVIRLSYGSRTIFWWSYLLVWAILLRTSLIPNNTSNFAGKIILSGSKLIYKKISTDR